MTVTDFVNGDTVRSTFSAVVRSLVLCLLGTSLYIFNGIADDVKETKNLFVEFREISNRRLDLLEYRIEKAEDKFSPRFGLDYDPRLQRIPPESKYEQSQ